MAPPLAPPSVAYLTTKQWVRAMTLPPLGIHLLDVSDGGVNFETSVTG